MINTHTNKKFIVIILISFCFLSLFSKSASAARLDELKEEIESHTGEIEKIEKEIVEYRKKLSVVKEKSDTLQNEINRIDTTRAKVSADINLTGKKINATSLNLEKIAIEIDEAGQEIEKNKLVIAESIRQVNMIDQESLVEVFLTHDSLSDFLQETSALTKVQVEMKNDLNDLRNKQLSLTKKKQTEEEEKTELNTLKIRLDSQKEIADQNRREQGILLASTKNEESAYQKQLAERLARKQQIENEIRRIEEQIKVEIDPQSLPSTGKNILSWPLKEVKITQYFGNTSFASQNPQVYSGNGHNGIDLAAVTGTPVFAASAGRVIGVDDTDRACPGASYGKWVLIEHNNNLSTLYAHLSHSAVKEGDIVIVGQEIAYTGNSGYTTGPHLHFEVLASKAVRVTDGITELKSKSCAGAVYRLPLSGFNGKLNPLSYL